VKRVINAFAVLLLSQVAAHAQSPFVDISALDGERIVNEPIEDNPAIDHEVPDPVTWNTAVTDDFRFTCFTICVETGLWGGAPEDRVERSAYSGLIAISPSVCLGVSHAPGSGEHLRWMTEAGVEIERRRSSSGPVPGVSDLSYTILDEPLPASIAPVKILADSTALFTTDVVAIEQDRHLNLMSTGPPYQQPANEYTYTIISRPSADNDGLEGGDSGKVGLTFVAGGVGEPAEPVLVLLLAQGGGSGGRSTGIGPNPSAALAFLQAIAAGRGETLDILAIDGYDPPPAAAFPAGDYFLRGDNNKTLTVGGVPVILEVSE
jgi:hypothetical protein